MAEGQPGIKKEDQIYGQKLAEMAKKHSSEAFYVFKEPLEAAIFSVLVEIMKDRVGKSALRRLPHSLGANNRAPITFALPPRLFLILSAWNRIASGESWLHSGPLGRGMHVDFRLLLQGRCGTLEPRERSFYPYLKDPHAHWDMIEGLKSRFRVEECSFKSIFGSFQGYKIFGSRKVAEKIEIQTRYAAELYNVDVRQDQRYLAEKDLFPCGNELDPNRHQIWRIASPYQ